MLHRPNPAARLLRALAADARGYGLTLRPVSDDTIPWASATFVGVRLSVHLAVTGGDPAAWLAALPEADLPVPGHLVADCVVARADPSAVALDVLLLEA